MKERGQSRERSKLGSSYKIQISFQKKYEIAENVSSKVDKASVLGYSYKTPRQILHIVCPHQIRVQLLSTSGSCIL